ncbi:MAG: PAS domain S-box protein, partial [Chloroflexaceae bacterium]|nr:PAS domain S-box protein [Chloroflexaceae bacterium]
MDDGALRPPALERILDLATDAIISVDESQRVVLFNQGAAQLFGYTAAEVLGQPLDLLLPPRFAAAHQQHVHAFGRAAEVARPRAMGQQREIAGRRKDGSEFPAEASIVKFVESDQTTFTVILRDISERKQSEAALRQAETRYRLLIDGIKDYAIYLLDPTGHVASWNAGAERMKGYLASEILGQHFACFFTPEDIALGRPEAELHTARTTGRYEEEGWRVRKHGTRFWASVVVSAVYDEQGQLRGFAKVTRDSTERRQADETLRRYAKQLHVLYEISRAILAAQSPQAIAEAALHRLRSIVPCHYSHIVSLPADGSAARLLMIDADAPFNNDGASREVGVVFTATAPAPPDQPVRLINLAAQPFATSTTHALRAAGLQLLAIAPLVAHQALIGELVLARAEQVA